MAKADVDLAKFLKCELCCHYFQDPKLLDCLHTFCEKCILKSNTESIGKSVLCPKCQLPTSLTDGLTSNHLISELSVLSGLKSLAETSPLMVKCHECILGNAKQTAVFVCLICLQPMCNVDKNAHVKHFADHTYLSINELAEKNVLDIISTKVSKQNCCSEHPNRIGTALCIDCNKILCADKCAASHQDCDISREFQNILTDNKQQLSSLMLKATETAAEMRTTIQQFGKKKKNAELSLQLLEATIDREFSSILKSLVDRKQELVLEAKREYQPTIDAIVEESTLLYRKMKALTDATQFCQLVADSDYSPSLPHIFKCYTDLSTFSKIPEYGYLPEYKFCLDKTLRTTVSCLGKLTHVREVSASAGAKILPQVDSSAKLAAMAFDGIDKLYLFDKQNNKIMVLSEKLEELREFKVDFEEGPISLSANNSYLFVCFHEENIVRVFSAAGDLYCDLEGGKAGDKHLFDFSDNFTGICCSREGHLLVADSGNNRVHVYSPELKFSHFIGELFEAGALRCPVDVSVNSQSQVAVLHWANPCINLYTLKGVILSQFGSLLGSQELSLPVKISFLAGDQLIVLDYKSQNLSVYSSERKFLTRFENILPPSLDNNIPSLAPCNHGDLYFCEPTSGQVILYKKQIFL